MIGASRYFADRMWAPRYWVKVGTGASVDPDYWRGISWRGHPKVAYPIDGAIH